jgi:hypothetical protein
MWNTENSLKYYYSGYLNHPECLEDVYTGTKVIMVAFQIFWTPSRMYGEVSIHYQYLLTDQEKSDLKSLPVTRGNSQVTSSLVNV